MVSLLIKDSGDPLMLAGDGDVSFRHGRSTSGSAYKWYFLLGGGFLGVTAFVVLCLLEQVSS